MASGRTSGSIRSRATNLEMTIEYKQNLGNSPPLSWR